MLNLNFEYVIAGWVIMFSVSIIWNVRVRDSDAMQQSPDDNIRWWRGKRKISNKYKSAMLISLVIIIY